jgi:hypothetical protein
VGHEARVGDEKCIQNFSKNTERKRVVSKAGLR